MKRKNDRISELEAEVKRLKALKSGGSSYGSGGSGYGSGRGSSGAPRDKTADEKRAVTCVAWNEGGCSKPGCSLRHGCARVTGRNRVCWSTEHKEKDHK